MEALPPIPWDGAADAVDDDGDDDADVDDDDPPDPCGGVAPHSLGRCGASEEFTAAPALTLALYGPLNFYSKVLLTLALYNPLNFYSNTLIIITKIFTYISFVKSS